ncbi:MAG: 50S ribosomal protein L37ae [Candidatus Bathyarchaeota archaeon]
MKKTKKVGPMGRYGARGGTSLRKLRGKIEIEMKQKHECPKCAFKTVKRVSVGIWKCTRCNYTFAGGAYLPTTKLGEIAKKAMA